MVGLRRKKPIKRGAPPKRKTRLSPVNRKRRKKMHERNFGQRATLVREMPCLCVHALRSWSFDDLDTPGARQQCSPGGVDAAHAIARGMGGAKGDRRDLVPLCRRHHDEAGERRTSQRTDFEQRYSLDLQAEAKRIAEHFDQMGIP